MRSAENHKNNLGYTIMFWAVQIRGYDPQHFGDWLAARKYPIKHKIARRALTELLEDLPAWVS